jgi:hypothetical protein
LSDNGTSKPQKRLVGFKWLNYITYIPQHTLQIQQCLAAHQFLIHTFFHSKKVTFSQQKSNFFTAHFDWHLLEIQILIFYWIPMILKFLIWHFVRLYQIWWKWLPVHSRSQKYVWVVFVGTRFEAHSK